MATHSSILAWRIPRTEEPGGPQSMAGYSLWGHKESDTTEQLTLALFDIFSLGMIPVYLTPTASRGQGRGREAAGGVAPGNPNPTSASSVSSLLELGKPGLEKLPSACLVRSLGRGQHSAGWTLQHTIAAPTFKALRQNFPHFTGKETDPETVSDLLIVTSEQVTRTTRSSVSDFGHAPQGRCRLSAGLAPGPGPGGAAGTASHTLSPSLKGLSGGADTSAAAQVLN